jgi:hypothetical protein
MINSAITTNKKGFTNKMKEKNNREDMFISLGFKSITMDDIAGEKKNNLQVFCQ